jgi:LPXTG-motif cell wall-anchored protein
MELQNVSKATLHDLTIDGAFQTENSNEPTGIFLLQCDNITLNQNQLLNNYAGLSIQYSSCTVTNNRIMDNAGTGINLVGSNIEVNSNVIARNDLGLQIDGSNNLIKANDILNNKRIGVFLSGSQNVLTENDIERHNDKLSGYGIQMDPYASGNTFYHNDFANNIVQVEGGNLAAVANIWDLGYPQGGNYWDTYHGVDIYSGLSQNQTGSDGLGDTSYQVYSVNKDNYPLIAPFRAAQDINQTNTTNTNNYALIAIVAIAIVAGTLGAGFVLRRRKNKHAKQNNFSQTNEKDAAKGILILVTITFPLMIVLNYAIISTNSYGLGAIEVFGGALYFDEILIGFISSLAAFFFTYKIIIKQKLNSKKWEQALSATLSASIFVVLLLAYTANNSFELFGSSQTSNPAIVMAWTFVTALLGCWLGFFLGGIGLKRIKPLRGSII